MMNFKIQGFFTTLIIATVSALTISNAISQKVNAQATPSCNNATIKGSYGFKLTGTIQGSSYAEVDLIKLNGRGIFELTGARTASNTVNGYSLTNVTAAGTYSVKHDCTVQLFSSEDSATYSGTIVDGGKEIFIIITVRGAVVTGTLKRVN
ncbi:hypothetical protein [Nostoc sp.]